MDIRLALLRLQVAKWYRLCLRKPPSALPIVQMIDAVGPDYRDSTKSKQEKADLLTSRHRKSLEVTTRHQLTEIIHFFSSLIQPRVHRDQNPGLWAS
jgi:hypothetical protein